MHTGPSAPCLAPQTGGLGVEWASNREVSTSNRILNLPAALTRGFSASLPPFGGPGLSFHFILENHHFTVSARVIPGSLLPASSAQVYPEHGSNRSEVVSPRISPENLGSGRETLLFPL